jgi:hypothetical protein
MYVGNGGESTEPHDVLIDRIQGAVVVLMHPCFFFLIRMGRRPVRSRDVLREGFTLGGRGVWRKWHHANRAARRSLVID